MMGPEDRKVLARLVGPTTYGRGVEYATSGAVRKATWSPGGTTVVGEVQGGTARPYYTSVRLTRTRGERLSTFRASCTCPVGFDCKHAVALVLADHPAQDTGTDPVLTLVQGGSAGRGGRGARGARVGPEPADRPAGWEGPLLELLGSGSGSGAGAGAGQAEPGQAVIGLQFEVVSTPKRGAGSSERSGPGIRVRPVLPGQKGNWVRTGVSWSNLEYLHYGRSRSPRLGEQVAVAREFLALSRLSQRGGTYRYGDDIVWLEAIASRRLWDLLAEARDRGVALVTAARPAGPVRVHPSSATVTVDVRRSPSGLHLVTGISLDDRPVPTGTSVLIGQPAHGVAWWGQPTATGSVPALELAALSTPVDDGVRDLLGREVLEVPPPDEDRFLRSFLPPLRRRVSVRSDDPSVDLPEDAPRVVVLEVTFRPGQGIVLHWWRGTVGSAWREALWDDRTWTGGRAPDDDLAPTLDELVRVVGAVPELVDDSPYGSRVAAEVTLEGMAAVRFVTELLPALSALDRLEVEVSGTAPEYHEEVAAPVVRVSGSESSDNDWFDLTVTVTVGDDEVPFTDLFVALAEGRSHLILPSGTYFSLDRDELRELAGLIAEARALLDAPDDTIRLSRFQAGLWDDIQQLGVVTAQAGAWQESIRALADAGDLTVHPVPDSLHATLRPYQVTGFNWLAYLYENRLGGILADDMGLGKTLEALALICHTRERDLTDLAFLVVAPTSVVGNWASECRRFAPDLAVATVTETAGRRGVDLASVVAGADVVITSYSLFRLEYEAYAGLSWAGLFLDEAQFAKNRSSQTYQRAKLLPVPFKVAMTGTPIENNLMELWSLFSITAPGLFPHPDRFGEYYRLPIERKGDADRLAQLRRRIRPLMLRRTKEQVAADLPDKQEQVLELELAPKHRRVYQTHLQRERQKVLGLLGDMAKNRMAIFTSLTLLRQASLDVSLIDDTYDNVPSTKLDALMEMVDDIVEDGHRVLVFSQFTRFLTLARRRMEAAGIEHCYLDGRTRRRDAVITSFRTGAAPVFLISLKAGGFGLNLTEADYCILLDPWWNPATEAQAVDRIHRIGQTRKVMVYRLVAKDTIEEKVMALKAKKSALFADVMDAGGLESGALTAADIRSLLE